MTEFNDKLGQPIEVGSIVAYPISASTIGIGKVTKLNEKMITISALQTKRPNTVRKYYAQVVSIGDIPETLMYLLTTQ